MTVQLYRSGTPFCSEVSRRVNSCFNLLLVQKWLKLLFVYSVPLPDRNILRVPFSAMYSLNFCNEWFFVYFTTACEPCSSMNVTKYRKPSTLDGFTGPATSVKVRSWAFEAFIFWICLGTGVLVVLAEKQVLHFSSGASKSRQRVFQIPIK